MSNFKDVLIDAAERFYNSATDRKYGCLDAFLDCEDSNDVEDILNEYRNSPNGEENFNNAIDEAFTYNDDMWAVIMVDTTPLDIFNERISGLDIYDEFTRDVFDKVVNMFTDNFDKLQQKARERTK